MSYPRSTWPEFDPDLTVPRRFIAPPPADTSAKRAALTSEQKMLEREAEPILNRLAEVRQQLATLPKAA